MIIGKELLYLTRRDICDVGLPMKAYIDALDQAFADKSKGLVKLPEKSTLRPIDTSFMEAMPCCVCQTKYVGMKWLSYAKENPQRSLPVITGMIALNDMETGFPLAVMDCTEITAMRTGAVSGLAARYLANPNSKTVAVLGCGLQGRTNLEAVLCECPRVETVYAWGPRRPSVERYAKEMEEKFHIAVHIAESAQEAVSLADIVIVTGPHQEKEKSRVIESPWLKEGVTVLTVNFDCHLIHGVLSTAFDKVYVDDTTLFEKNRQRGYYSGYDKTPFELADMITKKVSGREDARERIISMPSGIGLSDITSACRVYELAVKKEIGTLLPL